jgi:peptide/nickel transport system permease protein
VPFEDGPLRWLGSLIVPWLVLGLPLAAVCKRMMNSSMREVMHEEFVRTAVAKGSRRATSCAATRCRRPWRPCSRLPA